MYVERRVRQEVIKDIVSPLFSCCQPATSVHNRDDIPVRLDGCVIEETEKEMNKMYFMTNMEAKQLSHAE